MSSQKSHQPRILITAGPTLEHLDPIRSIVNRSSGKMGLALARACRKKDIPVQVLLGPVETTVEQEYRRHGQVASYETSQDLEDLLDKFWPKYDLLFMAAAVSDLRPAEVAHSKLPRSAISINLEPVPDLLSRLATRWPSHGIRIGFALEDESQLIDGAKRKLKAKGCHAIAANPLGTISSDSVSGVWVTRKGHEALGLLSKEHYAAELLNRALQLCPGVSD